MKNRTYVRNAVSGLLRRAPFSMVRAAFCVSSAVVAWALLLTSCIKEDAGSCGSVGGPDGAVTVGFRSGTFAIAGPSGADDGWGTSATGARSASTRAGVPPTGMVEGAFQIGDLWVDGNRGSTQEKLMTWAEATVYCRSLGLRLPNYEEMESIVSYVVKNSPLPDNAKFEFKPEGTWSQYYYWTSTPRDADASYVWVGYLYPSSAYMDGAPADDNEMVSARCVKREGEEILPPAPDPGPDVEHPDGLPVGTTFRVVVYAAGADPQSDSPVDQNTYKIADTKGTIVASAVDEFGNATDDAARELVLRRGAYDFYYFSPAVPASTSMPNPGRYTDLTNGADYMALAHREVIDPSQGPKHYIPEVCFYRMGSYIDVRISPREGEIMGTLEVSGDGLQLWGLPGSGRYEIGEYPYRLITEGSGGMVEFSPADFAAEEGATTTVATLGTGGGRAVLPGYARDLQVKVTLTSDGKELKLDASLAGHNFAPGYRYVVELGVGRIADNPELSIDILPWNEYDWGDGFIGDRFSVDGAEVTPSGDIPAEGKTFSLTLTGNLPTAGVEVRAQSGGTALATGKVTASGTAVELVVPANAGYSSRSVTFEYLWRNTWTQIGDSRSQAGYSVSDATHNAPATIPGPGATYSVTITGVLPADGVEVRAQSGGTALATGKVTASGAAASLTVPANDTGADRTVTFEYLWNGTWTKIGDSRSQAPARVESATISPDPSGGFRADATTFTVTLTGYLGSGISVQARISGQTTALVSATATVSGTGVTLTVPENVYPNAARTIVFGYVEGGAFKEIKRGMQAVDYIDTGGGGTVLDLADSNRTGIWQEAIDYCSSKGDGWRLPMQNELMYYWCVEPSIPADSKFLGFIYWSATESGNNDSVWFLSVLSHGIITSNKKSYSNNMRCVREYAQKYPYVTTGTGGGVIVVLRDENGGIDEASLFSSRVTESKTGNVSSADNRMSRKFRVQKAQSQSSKVAWSDAVSYCDNLTEEGYSDWRLPSQRELMMIWFLGGNSNVTSGEKNDSGVGSASYPFVSSYLYQQSGFTAFSADYYWTASVDIDPYAWSTYFLNGYTYNYVNRTNSIYVRCVRDEW